MYRLKNIWILLAFLFGSLFVFSQEADLDQIIDSVTVNLKNVENYQVDALFSFDIDFIKMPDKNSRISYESPDKFDVEADGFIMVPKIGLRPLQKQLDVEKYHTVFDSYDEIDGEKCLVVKMIPKERNSKIILSTFWIRMSDYFIMRVETFAKKSGSFLIDMKYEDDVLPAKMVFSFEVEGMNIPLKYFGSGAEIEKSEFKSQKMKKGNVTITFSNYIINYK